MESRLSVAGLPLLPRCFIDYGGPRSIHLGCCGSQTTSCFLGIAAGNGDIRKALAVWMGVACEEIDVDGSARECQGLGAWSLIV